VNLHGGRARSALQLPGLHSPHFLCSNSSSVSRMAISLLTSYSYDSLASSSSKFRLLTLQPATERHAPLRGSLETRSLAEDDLGYGAVSYCWGNPARKHPLWIGNQAMAISDNLSTALKYLRHETMPMPFWVDAICINQDSISEKNHQVRRIRRIYSTACVVLVWLGESDLDIDAAFRFLADSRQRLDKSEMPLQGLKKIFTKPW
jgi:hypothetical protein